jgi:uncharacterized protein (TIGR02757 family)
LTIDDNQLTMGNEHKMIVGVPVTHSMRCLAYVLDELYERYNRRQFVHPDPLEFLYAYGDSHDREIVALIAAGLAYGRVAQILRSIQNLLGRMGPSPYRFLQRTAPGNLPELFADFKHRWTTGREVADLLAGVRTAIERHGSLGQCFLAGLRGEHDSILPALGRFVEEVRLADHGKRNSLLPDVSAGGACKRLHLMLRWLARRDAVDPGGWDEIPAKWLIVPLDTHMHRVGMALGLCERRQADRTAALAMTDAFRAIQPEDPVRYDFALTRLGIRPELDLAGFLARCRKLQVRWIRLS